MFPNQKKQPGKKFPRSVAKNLKSKPKGQMPSLPQGALQNARMAQPRPRFGY